MKDSLKNKIQRLHTMVGAVVLMLGIAVSVQAGATDRDLLRFLDGSMLHGRLEEVGLESGVRWKHPDAANAVDFKPDNLAWIRFEGTRPVERRNDPTCHIRFRNGDEVLGRMLSLSEAAVEFSTWFGNRLSAPRESLRSLAFLSPGFRIIYEGPIGLEGWKRGRDPNAWKYQDGIFISTGVGVLGRDFQFRGSSRIEFDLQWNGTFSLIVPVYTAALDRFDYRSNSYMFYISRGYVSLQRVQAGAGVRNLGQGQIPGMQGKTRVHVEIRVNKPEAEMEIFIDGKRIRQWRDSGGFAGTGTGMAFFSQLNGPIVQISNIRVSAWDGYSDPVELQRNTGPEDLVYLRNRDQVPGKLKSMDAQNVLISSLGTELKIPLQRVTRVAISEAGYAPLQETPWEVRAHFPGGMAVSFILDSWREGLLSGRSANFGPVTFDAQHIRRVQFNLGRSKQTGETSGGGPGKLWPWDD